jgi:alkylhydroperoxidase family enzyme
MAYISYSENGTNPLTQLLGHNPELLKNWMALLDSFYKCSDLDRALQEEVRRAVAYSMGCAYCMSHGCPTEVIEDVKTQAAVDFAKKVVQTYRHITPSDIEMLRQHFSEKEISELCAFVCYGIGLARFGAVLNVDVSL